ncbi:MAG: nuclear transport factor 2 family protein [Actinomadura sp.]
MSEQTGPQELFARFQHNILSGGVSFTEEMCAEDIVVEMPLLPAGLPRRIEGRAEFIAFVTAGREGLPVKFEEFRDVVIHQTTDPEVIVAEYELAGRAMDSDIEASSAFIVVLRARDGRIVHWREYQDIAAMAAALEVGLPDVS